VLGPVPAPKAMQPDTRDLERRRAGIKWSAAPDTERFRPGVLVVAVVLLKEIGVRMG